MQLLSDKLNIRGDLILPYDPIYDEVRQLYNGMIDKRPQLIARCADVADVIAAVQFARQHGLITAVRGGGHNGAGLGSCDDGLVIDLSQLKGIQIDAEHRTVQVEPGCTQGEVDEACHPFGFAVPAGIVSSTGMAGLTLGGGHGYLSRQYGLTIDNLIEADVVLADGHLVTTNESQYSDLFWALRGGGGNFGIVTRFAYQAHPVSLVYGGPVFWHWEHARQVMQRYREFLPHAPEALCPFLALQVVPSAPPFPEILWGQKVCTLVVCYNGPQDQAKAAIAPLFDVLPTPAFQHLDMMPFPVLQGLFDPLLPKGLQWYWTGDFVQTLSDEAIDVHLEHAAQFPSELSTMHLYPIDGAVQRVAATATAWNYRSATWSMVIAGIDPNPSKANDLTRWAKAYWQAVHHHTLRGAYVNFMMEEGSDRIRATYGENYERLVAIKTKYDPTNFFRVNQNIQPADNG